MYQFSRSIYRRLSPMVAGCDAIDRQRNRTELLRAVELAMERLGSDPFYFNQPARSIFRDIRLLFPISQQRVVYGVVRCHVDLATRYVADHLRQGVTFDGSPLLCNSNTRKGRQCGRAPLPGSKYCPSHQHLSETAQEVSAAA